MYSPDAPIKAKTIAQQAITDSIVSFLQTGETLILLLAPARAPGHIYSRVRVCCLRYLGLPATTYN